MEKQWQKILSILLCVLLVSALVPPVAAATVVGEVSKIVLEPEKDQWFHGVGEGLVVRDYDGGKNYFYPANGDGTIQTAKEYAIDDYWLYSDDYDYYHGQTNKEYTVIDGTTGEIVWQRAGEYMNGCAQWVCYQTETGAYELYDLDTKTNYSLPGDIRGHMFIGSDNSNYGDGKLILRDEDSWDYYYYDLRTGQDAFQGKMYDYAYPFSGGYAVVTSEGTDRIIDSNGQVTCTNPEDYWIRGTMSEGLFMALDGEWGYIDHTGAVVIPFRYSDVSSFHNGYARATVGGSVYGLIERSTGDFIQLNMNILTAASSAGTVWASTWDDPSTAYLIKIADLKGVTQLHAVKYVPYSEQLMDWDESYTVTDLEGLPSGLEFKNGVLTGVVDQAGMYSFSFSAAGLTRSYVLTVTENADEAVDASISDGYEIETYIPDTVTGEQDQLFTIDDVATSDAGSNYERFLDVYLDGVKLKGGKVTDPAQAGADWEYYAMEGSTKITVYSKTFQNKPEGTHTISATFQALDKIPGKVDTVSQNFELKRPTKPSNPQPSNPQPSNPGPVKVGDVVDFTGNVHYTTSYDQLGWKCLPGQALVTRIFEKGKHQYHLIATEGSTSTVYGWVNATDITGPVAPETPANPAGQGIVKGSKVTVKAGAKTYTGGSLAGFVYKTTYTVIQISGNRVVIGLNGVATAAMNIKDLTLVD